MQRAIATKTGRCAHCCEEGEVTDDHVPPKNLFPKKLRREIAIVPACLRCNRGSSDDDEYFRLMLIMRADVSENPKLDEVVETTWRSLDREKARGFATGFRNKFWLRDLFTPSGVFIGRKPGYEVDVDRMRRVIRRTTSGLYLFETGQALPKDREMQVLDELSSEAFTPDQVRALGEFLSRQTFTHRAVADGLFSYSFCIFPEVPCLSHWKLRFYDRVSFHCATRAKPPDD